MNVGEALRPAVFHRHVTEKWVFSPPAVRNRARIERKSPEKMMSTATPPRIKGVFSCEDTGYVGFGGTKRKIGRNFHVYAEEQDDGRILVQSLNSGMAPSGPQEIMSREELLSKFLPEPELYLNQVLPLMEKVESHVERGDRHRAKGESYSAEFEYRSALDLAEDHVRAVFGLGLVYLDRGDAASGAQVFKRLVGLRAAFEARHKHLFNEFGIKLRKCGLFAEALEYYSRAREFSGDDENLTYNIGRAWFEKGDPARARKLLLQALEMRPDFPECREFLAVVEHTLSPRPGARVRHRSETGREDARRSGGQ